MVSSRRRMSSLLCFAAGLTIAVGMSRAADAVTLQDALARAYDTNPTLQAARAELRATDEQIAQAKSLRRPTVDVTGEVGGQVYDSDTRGDGSSVPGTVALNLTQPIYRGGSIDAGISQADNVIFAQRATLISVEQQVLLRAVSAYMDVVRDQAVLELTLNNEEVLTRQLEATRVRFEVGELTRTDVAQAESRLAGATAQRIQAEGGLTTSVAVYREVIGEDPVDLQPAGPPASLPGDETETVAASSANPDLVAAQFLERAARDGTDVVFGELLPRVDVVGRLQAEDDISRDGQYDNSAQALLQVRIPLYQAGGVDSRVREAKQRVSQRRQQVQEQQRAATQQATSAWRALETARAQIVSFEFQVKATEIALQGVREEAQVGARTVLDTLDAEQEFLDARVSLVRARRDEVVAAHQVLAAVGQLTAANLNLPATPYDVELNYDRVRDKFWGTDINGQ